MKLEPLEIAGAALLRGEAREDHRGTFTRVVDVAQLGAYGLDAGVDQVSTVFNHARGTVRGLHYQAAPHVEAKTLWCTSGSVYDVIVDLRLDQPTYGTWQAVELVSSDPVALHVPAGVAHGYQTLTDGAEMTYLISTPYVAQSARSLLWCDPTLAITWPLGVSAISDRDKEAQPWPPQP